MSLVQPANLIRKLLPGSIWRMPDSGKTVYLTFDDGPTPGVTEQVLSMLHEVGAKATFFCIGNCVEKHPQLFHKLIEEGHAIGNHSYSHCNGWKVSFSKYVDDVKQCSTVFHSQLFRPPYGKLSPRQFLHLRKSYTIVMWDVLSMDYDSRLSAETCLENVLHHVRNGSVITFHDSLKAWPILKEILPQILKDISSKGFTFSVIHPKVFISK
jgi:peptidoglycan/xylan/chitin deacetylase (PgdA/CDA1 family)